MKKRFAVYRNDCFYPMFVSDNEAEAREWWLNQCAWSANYYCKAIEVEDLFKTE